MILAADKGKVSGADIEAAKRIALKYGLGTNVDTGTTKVVVGIKGDFILQQAEDEFRGIGNFEVTRLTKGSYKLASRQFHPSATEIELPTGHKTGGGTLTFMAGQCSLDDWAYVKESAIMAKEAGADVLRMMPLKPRTSPYSFQGLGWKGFEMIARAKQETGLPVITEILMPEDDTISPQELVKRFEEFGVDIYQVGARNAQNFGLLHALSKTKKPVLLKNGTGQNAEEMLHGAEYILSGAWGPGNSHNGDGNPNVMLCARGSSGETTASRFPLDIAWVPYLRQRTHLPIIGDPHHSTGDWRNVTDVALGLIGAGVDGLELEIHPEPRKALSDQKQSIGPKQLEEIITVGTQIFAARKGLALEDSSAPYYR